MRSDVGLLSSLTVSRQASSLLIGLRNLGKLSFSFEIKEKPPEGMELWACGFNAFNQLQFVDEISSESEDLAGFSLVLENGSIEILRTTTSATLVQTASGSRLAGFSDAFATHRHESIDSLMSLAVAGNDKVAEIVKGSIIEYPSLDDYLKKRGLRLEGLENIIQIAANQASFTALSATGKIYTWGDARYEACLGREVNSETPASEPHVVEDLADLPDSIRKVSSGGYATAALTSANDVYFWGRPGQPEGLLTSSPMPLDLDGQDILDVSVGFNHLMALTADHRLFLAGDGGSGQLGTDARQLNDWQEIILPLSVEQKVVGVHAGYKNSFVLVKNSTSNAR